MSAKTHSLAYTLPAAQVIRLGLILTLTFCLIFPVFAAPGDLDTTFGLSASGVNFTDIGVQTGDMAFAVAVQDDGKIVVAGKSDTDIALTRYTDAGLLDISFSGDGKQTIPIGGIADVANAIAIQGDGKILLVGSTSDGLKDDFLLVRLTDTGALDTLFNGTGIVTTTLSTGNDVANAIALQEDGKIVVAGAAGAEFGVARYDTSGNLDVGFGGGVGFVTTSFYNSGDAVYALAIQTDGMIVAAGSANNGFDDDFALARYNSTGALDTTFGGGDGKINTNFAPTSNDFAYGIDLQPDGKIVAAGISDTTNEDFAVARYTSSGNLDSTFSVDGRQVTAITANNDQAHAVMVQPTGKIVVAGMSFTMGTANDFTVVRYTALGELDTTFGSTGIVVTDLGPQLSGNPGEHTDDLGYAAALQSDNKIIVAGYSDYPLATGDNNFILARYESPNSLPVIADVAKLGWEDTTLTFASADFSAQFTDTDGDSLQSVRIGSLPGSGALRLNSVDVTLDQVIPLASLDNLTYHPALNVTGVISYTWNGSDGVDYAAFPAVVSMTLQAINDAPSFQAGSDPGVLEDAGVSTLSGWATAISPGAADEVGQTLTFTVATDNDALFSALPVVDAVSGDLTFTSAPDANGTANCTISLKDDGGTANGGADTSAVQFFSINVTAVNDAPSFLGGPDDATNEDSSMRVVPSWADAISTGPADENTQTVWFNVTSADTTLFSNGPAISPMGVLNYTPAPDAYGTSVITVTAQDSGGTANGGINISEAYTFTITIQPINDAPSFVVGADVIVNEDAGFQSVPAWATAISPGATNESGQVLTFLTQTSNDDLFAALPAIDTTSGDLTFNSMPNLYGTAVISVTLQDDGGTANGGVDASGVQTFTITIEPVNDAPNVVDVNKISFKNAKMVFSGADFANGFDDIDGDLLAIVRITALPLTGDLFLNGIAVTAGQEIPVADLVNLVFIPETGWLGSTSFEWNGSDGALYAAAPALVNITYQAEAPFQVHLPLVTR